MSKLLKSKIFLGVMLVAVFIGGALAVNTALAQQAVVTVSDVQYAATVKLGSSGQAALIWQRFLNGYSTTAQLVEDGKFGPLSTVQAKAWQASKGLVADGVLGALSRATAMAQITAGAPASAFPAGCTSTVGYSSVTGMKCDTTTTYPAGCTSAVGYSPTTGAKCDATGTTPAGPLTGGAGSIEDADFVSGLTGEEVGEDAEDVKVAGLDIDADDGSDLNLTAVRLDFTVGTADQDFEDYASEVSLWFEGKEVARVDADEFTDDNNYDKTISLDSDAVIKAGGTGQLVVAVTGIANLDTNDATDTWTVEFESVRYEDASGAILTDTATGDIAGVTRTFSFETFAVSTDIELKIAEKTGSAADLINKSHMINSHATEATNNVKLLSFTLEAEGDSDLEIREFLTDFVVTGAADVDDVIQGGASPAARLFIDGEEYGTATYFVDGDGITVGADEPIFWDDVNYTLAAGAKVDAYIEVDLNDTTGEAVGDQTDEGDTILAQITAAMHDALTDMDVRDETGTQVAHADITGTATGEANQIYDVSFTVATSGWTNTAVLVGGFTNEDDEVTFNLEYTVTAVDGDVYIDNTCTEDADGTLVLADDATDGFIYSQTDGTDANVALTCSHTTTSGATLSTDRWLVTQGESETFKVAVRAINDLNADSFVQVAWEGMGWSEADEAGDRLFEGSLDDTYLSNSISLNQR